MKDRFMKNGVFSLEYDKETLRDMVLELQEENKKQKEVIDKLNFIKNRKNQGASQENINKMAIEFVNIEESIQQIETLIEAWQLDEAGLNQTDINAMQVLLKENQELKEKLDKYENPEDMTLMMMWCTEQVKDENKKLKKQLENTITSYTEEHNLRHNSDLKLDVLETQQKEFIEYMNKTIEELECDDVDDEEIKGYLIQRIDTFKEILLKYKEII